MAITTRSGKGSALTHSEMDNNLNQIPNGSNSSITDDGTNVTLSGNINGVDASDLTSKTYVDNNLNQIPNGSEHYDQETAPTPQSVGATWYVPSTGHLYKYVNDGTNDVWIDISTAGNGSEHYDQETAPTPTGTGATWYIPSTGYLYKFVEEGTNQFWIDISTAGAGLSSNDIIGSGGILENHDGITVDSSGKVGIGTSNPTHKLDVSEQATFRGGITFNGDTSSANALDDYEEGTWTPALERIGSGNQGQTYSAQTGKYTKIGNLVTIIGDITLSSKGSMTEGDVAIMGLPFATTDVPSLNIGMAQNVICGADRQLCGYSFSGNSYIALRNEKHDVASSKENTKTSDLTDTTNIIFSMSYRVS